MSAVILDTNAYVAFKRGDENVVEILRLAEEIIVPSIVLGELLAGFVCGAREAENRRELATFLDAPRVRTVAVDESTATWYARVYAGQRRAGRPLPSNDLWIGALCLQLGKPILTLDRHFTEIDGISVVTRPEDLLP